MFSRIQHGTDCQPEKYLYFKAVVKYVGGFWPMIGVFFAGYRSFFWFLVDKLRRKHAFKHANKKKTREDCCIVQVTCVQIFPNTS